MTAILFQLGMIALNLLFAKVEAYSFDVRQMPINHAFTAVMYGICTLWVLAFIPAYHWKAIWLWLAFIAMHFPVFSIALNTFRKPRRAWDYHNTTDLKGSKWDLLIDKWYDEVLFASAGAFVLLQLLIL